MGDFSNPEVGIATPSSGGPRRLGGAATPAGVSLFRSSGFFSAKCFRETCQSRAATLSHPAPRRPVRVTALSRLGDLCRDDARLGQDNLIIALK